MPHSYAIAIFRFKDYQAANIPVLPVVKGISVAKNHIGLYIIAIAALSVMMSVDFMVPDSHTLLASVW